MDDRNFYVYGNWLTFGIYDNGHHRVIVFGERHDSAGVHNTTKPKLLTHALINASCVHVDTMFHYCYELAGIRDTGIERKFSVGNDKKKEEQGGSSTSISTHMAQQHSHDGADNQAQQRFPLNISLTGVQPFIEALTLLQMRNLHLAERLFKLTVNSAISYELATWLKWMLKYNDAGYEIGFNTINIDERKQYLRGMPQIVLEMMTKAQANKLTLKYKYDAGYKKACDVWFSLTRRWMLAQVSWALLRAGVASATNPRLYHVLGVEMGLLRRLMENWFANEDTFVAHVGSMHAKNLHILLPSLGYKCMRYEEYSEAPNTITIFAKEWLPRTPPVTQSVVMPLSEGDGGRYLLDKSILFPWKTGLKLQASYRDSRLYGMAGKRLLLLWTLPEEISGLLINVYNRRDYHMDLSNLLQLKHVIWCLNTSVSDVVCSLLPSNHSDISYYESFSEKGMEGEDVNLLYTRLADKDNVVDIASQAKHFIRNKLPGNLAARFQWLQKMVEGLLAPDNKPPVLKHEFSLRITSWVLIKHLLHTVGSAPFSNEPIVILASISKGKAIEEALDFLQDKSDFSEKNMLLEQTGEDGWARMPDVSRFV